MQGNLKEAPPGTVLLVEDDPASVAVAQHLLRGQGWLLHHAGTLAQAEALLLGGLSPEVILLDVGLPDGTGLDGLRRLQDVAPYAAVVLLTNLDERDLGPAAITAGAEDFLSKDGLSRPLLLKTMAYARERSHRRGLLRRQQLELQQIFAAHPDALLVVSEDGKVESVSQAAAQLLQRTADQLIGVPPPFALRDDRPVTARLGEVYAEVEDRLLEAVSSRVILQERGVWLCAIRDISEREQLLKLQDQQAHADRMATLGQFAAGMAHELNNPATVLLSNLEMLQEDLDTLRTMVPPSGKRLLESSQEILAESLGTMHRIIAVSRSLQDLSRAREASSREVDLNVLVQRCCSFTRYRTRHLAQLQLQLQPLPPLLLDEEAISQALLNLILNAAEAIPEGAPQQHHITISTAQEDGWILLEVSDTGPGVPPSLRDRIFEPFFSTKNTRQGTGLGLALSRQVARRHHGEITYRPGDAGGACFQLRLPVRQLLTPGEHAHPPTAQPPPGGRRVLLIDDEPLLRDAMARLLRSDCTVVTAAGGREALALLEQDDDFDAVVSDLAMPDVDGAAVAGWLQRQRPELYPRLLIYTGGAVTDRLRIFIDQTDRPVLFKPLTRRDLLSAIAQLPRAANNP